MTKIKILTALTVLLLLGACESTRFNPQSTVRVINSMSYPEFPNIEPVSPVNLIPWTADVPRDMTKTVAKNITACQKVPEEDRNNVYWNRCGENPIITKSNIFIGFDQLNWNIIVENFAKLREQLFKHRNRIKEVNRQRESWREKAEAERQRVLGENVEITTEKNSETAAKKQENLVDKIKKRLEGINNKGFNSITVND